MLVFQEKFGWDGKNLFILKSSKITRNSFFLRYMIKVFQNSIFISFVYSSPDRNKRKMLWEALKKALPHDSSHCLIMGDFNAILLADDKKSYFVK